MTSAVNQSLTSTVSSAAIAASQQSVHDQKPHHNIWDSKRSKAPDPHFCQDLIQKLKKLQESEDGTESLAQNKLPEKELCDFIERTANDAAYFDTCFEDVLELILICENTNQLSPELLTKAATQIILAVQKDGRLISATAPKHLLAFGNFLNRVLSWDNSHDLNKIIGIGLAILPKKALAISQKLISHKPEGQDIELAAKCLFLAIPAERNKKNDEAILNLFIRLTDQMNLKTDGYHLRLINEVALKLLNLHIPLKADHYERVLKISNIFIEITPDKFEQNHSKFEYINYGLETLKILHGEMQTKPDTHLLLRKCKEYIILNLFEYLSLNKTIPELKEQLKQCFDFLHKIDNASDKPKMQVRCQEDPNFSAALDPETQQMVEDTSEKWNKLYELSQSEPVKFLEDFTFDVVGEVISSQMVLDYMVKPELRDKICAGGSKSIYTSIVSQLLDDERYTPDAYSDFLSVWNFIIPKLDEAKNDEWIDRTIESVRTFSMLIQLGGMKTEEICEKSAYLLKVLEAIKAQPVDWQNDAYQKIHEYLQDCIVLLGSYAFEKSDDKVKDFCVSLFKHYLSNANLFFTSSRAAFELIKDAHSKSIFKGMKELILVMLEYCPKEDLAPMVALFPWLQSSGFLVAHCTVEEIEKYTDFYYETVIKSEIPSIKDEAAKQSMIECLVDLSLKTKSEKRLACLSSYLLQIKPGLIKLDSAISILKGAINFAQKHDLSACKLDDFFRLCLPLLIPNADEGKIKEIVSLIKLCLSIKPKNPVNAKVLNQITYQFICSILKASKSKSDIISEALLKDVFLIALRDDSNPDAILHPILQLAAAVKVSARAIDYTFLCAELENMLKSLDINDLKAVDIFLAKMENLFLITRSSKDQTTFLTGILIKLFEKANSDTQLAALKELTTKHNFEVKEATPTAPNKTEKKKKRK